MIKFKVFETDQFQEDLVKDFEGQSQRINKKLREYIYPQLRENPYYGKNIKKLKAHKPETWRYRVGNYRFFYEIDNKTRIIYMIATEARKDSY